MAIDRYYYFKKLLALVEEEFDVTHATMSNYAGDVEVKGEDQYGNEVKIQVELFNNGGTEK